VHTPCWPRDRFEWDSLRYHQCRRFLRIRGGVRDEPSWHRKSALDFTGGADGASPQSSLVLDSLGNLYGTTYSGGTYGAGTVFMVTKAGKEKALYSFTGGTDGSNPIAALSMDTTGNLYGTANAGGA
jgi:uncharacterized repeat protein (TIGR03803 family)